MLMHLHAAAGTFGAPVYAAIDPFALFFAAGAIFMLALLGYGVFAPVKRPPFPADVNEPQSAASDSGAGSLVAAVSRPVS